MTDTDDIRLALTEAVALPGEVRPRPGAGTALRARARQRRRVRLIAGATAVPAVLIVIAVLLGGGGPDGRRVTTPATGGTTSQPAPSLAPGPRTLSMPIEIQPVVEELRTCPGDASETIAAAAGTSCFRLGPTGLTLRRLDSLQTAPRTGLDGTVVEGVSILLTMTPDDAAAFTALTTASVEEQLAVVVDGRVWTAPRVMTPITGGSLQIDVDESAAAELVAALTG